MTSESPEGTDTPRETVEDLEDQARAQSSADALAEEAKKERGADDGERGEDVAPKVPGSPEPPD